MCLLGNILAGVFNFERFMEIYSSKYWGNVHLEKESYPKCILGEFLFIDLLLSFNLDIPGFSSRGVKVFPPQQGD